MLILNCDLLQAWLRHLHCVACLLSHVRLFATPQTVAYQAPLPMGFCRQEYWSGLPFPPPGDLPEPGTEPVFPVSPALQVILYRLSHKNQISVSLVHINFYSPTEFFLSAPVFKILSRHRDMNLLKHWDAKIFSSPTLGFDFFLPSSYHRLKIYDLRELL